MNTGSRRRNDVPTSKMGVKGTETIILIIDPTEVFLMKIRVGRRSVVTCSLAATVVCGERT